MSKTPVIENHTAALMISVAVFFDILQWAMAFMAMDWLVSIFAYLTFGLWFAMKGIPILTKKRMGALGGSALIEMIPFVAALPAFTAAIVTVVLDAKAKKVISGVSGAGKVVGHIEPKRNPVRETSRKAA
jgi:hypothetical protein